MGNEEFTAELERKIEERTKQLKLFYEIGQEMLSSLNLKKVLNTIIQKTTQILDLEICSILLYDNKKKELRIAAASGLDEEIVKNISIEYGEMISGWVLKNKEPLFIEDIEKDSRFSRGNKERYYTRSFISVPLIAQGEAVGVINVNNKKSKESLKQDDFKFIRGIAVQAAIAIENAKLYTSLQDTYLRTLSSLTLAVDAKDHYTHSHSEHVTKYALAIAEEMGFSKEEKKLIEESCQLHDVGKIGIHDYILTKPEKLTPEEWNEVRQHSLTGAEILKPLVFLDGVIDFVEQHHERYDGKGYPRGLKGEEILLGARIIAVADSFDAMTTQRPYRKAYSIEEAVNELKRCSGTQFDPQAVEVFLKVLSKNPQVTNK